MTRSGSRATGLVVEGRLDDGTVAIRIRVGHGADPVALLLTAGWRAGGVVAIGGSPDPPEIVVSFQVAACATGAGRPDAAGAGAPADAIPHDPDLTSAELANAVPHQRIAAYAVVTGARGVLLTELSDRTNAPGVWTLPGGGIDAAEHPEDCVRRELWEETGQQVAALRPLGVLSRHWIGRAPSGRIEDYHVVGLVYAAQCDSPTEPVVHDAGGTTRSAAWVPAGEVCSLPLTQVCRWALDRAGVVP